MYIACIALEQTYTWNTYVSPFKNDEQIAGFLHLCVYRMLKSCAYRIWMKSSGRAGIFLPCMDVDQRYGAHLIPGCKESGPKLQVLVNCVSMIFFGGFINEESPNSWMVFSLGKSMNIPLKWLMTRATPMTMETSKSYFNGFWKIFRETGWFTPILGYPHILYCSCTINSSRGVALRFALSAPWTRGLGSAGWSSWGSCKPFGKSSNWGKFIG